MVMLEKTNQMQLFVNKANDRIMVQCRASVDKDAVSRIVENGIEHILVSSATLPDDIVMNGGLYPADEIAGSFEGLERTLAPIGHPINADGEFLLASDPDAIHGFHAGAFNVNVRQENGRVFLDKKINVQEAMKSDRGRRLLDRIKELETNEKPRPIHTSTGLLCEVENLAEPKTNAAGQKYVWIARNMVFDHDAILLDDPGAATPEQGVGMAVNEDGERITVNSFTFEQANEDQSHDARRDAVMEAFNKSPYAFDFIVHDGMFDDKVIFQSGDSLFVVPYVVDQQDIATIVGIPQEVEREVTYPLKVNQEGDDMKELILNALKEAEVDIEGMDDDALFAAYSELQANKSNGEDVNSEDNATALAAVLSTALTPITERLDRMDTKINAGDETELNRLADLVGNSDIYPGLDAADAKLLPLDKLKGLAANCQKSYGVNGGVSVQNQDLASVPTEMPE